MAVDSTTVEPVESAEQSTTDEAVDQSQQDESQQTTAELKSEDTSQASESVGEAEESGPEQSDNSEEADIKDWAAKKNLPLDDPLKIAKMYRESERQLGKKGQEEGQLKAAVTGANESAGVDDVQALRNEVTALSFWIQHPEARAYEPEMVSILEDKPWLANDLEVVLDAAKGRVGNTELVAQRQAGKKEALAQAEKSGRAAPPQASPTNTKLDSNRITLDNVDELIAKNGHAWYVKNRDKINQVLAGS